MSAAAPVREGAEWLPTRELAELLGRSTTRSGLFRLRARLYRYHVPFRGHRYRPRWNVERARLVLAE